MIRLDDIVVDAGTQVRAAIHEPTVADYADRLGEGVTFPAVVLFHDGNRYYLADGFHRVMAHRRAGRLAIDAEVRAGTREDALWFALGANKANGQRLTEQDKRHALLAAFHVWPERSARVVAEQIGCSSTYASRIRDEVRTSTHPGGRVVGSDGRSYPASTSARDATREAAAALLMTGASIADVRQATGIGRDAARALRREMGLSFDKSKAAVADRRDRMRAMAADGYTSRQIAADLRLSDEGCRRVLRAEGIDVPADAAIRNAHRHDSDRIVEHMVMDAENLTADVNLIDFEDLDPTKIEGWVTSLQASRRRLTAFLMRLQKGLRHEGAEPQTVESV